MDFCLKTTNLPLPHFFLLLLLDSVSCGGCLSLVGFFFVAGFSGSLFSGSLMLFMARTLGGPPDIAFPPPFPILQDAPSNASNLLFQS
jgi:hypothetical protein